MSWWTPARWRSGAFVAGVVTLLIAAAAPVAAEPPAHVSSSTDPGTVTSFTMFSESGDYIGGGLPREYDTTNGSITGTATLTGINMSVSGGTTGTSFGVTITPPPNTTFRTGFYDQAQRSPFRAEGRPGIDISGDGRGCNTIAGSFDVRDLEVTGTTITRLDLFYEQHCEGGLAALFGELRINEPTVGRLIETSGGVTWPSASPSSASTPIPIYIRNPNSVPVAIGTTAIATANPADFHLQNDGCAHQTIAPHSSCLLWVTSSPSGAGPRTGDLRVVVPAGTVHIQLDGSRRSGTTSWDMTSDPGDWVGAGGTYHYTTGISLSGSVAGVHGGVNSGGDWWYFDFVPGANQLLGPGEYDDAIRYPFQEDANGLSISGNGRGCNTLTGSFTVLQSVYSPIDGSLQHLDLTFVQHCEGGGPALRGELKWNSSPVTEAAPVTGLSATTSGTQAQVSWTNPTGPGVAYTVVRHHADVPYGSSALAGVADYSGPGTSATVSGLPLGRTVTVEVFAVDTYGNVSLPTTLTISTAASFTPLPPTRILDTRTDNVPADRAPGVPVGPGETLILPVAGEAGVPLDATAVVLNLTATGVTRGTFVTAHPAGTPVPNASNLNLVAGDTRPNLVTVALGAYGAVELTNQLGNVHLIADLAGYYSTGSPDRFTPLTPSRLLDTRSANVPATHPANTPVGPDETIELPVAGIHGVPSDATAVVVNLTGVGPTAATVVTAYPGQTTMPTASNLNLVAGAITPNLAVVKVGPNGTIDIHNQLGQVHLVVDVVGAYGPSGADLFVPASPTRLLDTRTGTVPSSWPANTPVGPNGLLDLPAAGTAGIPANADSVLLNITGTGVTAPTFVTAAPSGQPVPIASCLNLVAGETRANLDAVALGPDGHLVLHNQNGLIHLVVDLAGSFIPAPAGTIPPDPR